MFLKIEKVFKSHLHMIYNTKIKWYKNLLSLSTLWPQFNLLNRFYTTKSIQSFFHYVWEVRFPRGNLRFQKFKRGFNMLQNWLSTKYQPRHNELSPSIHKLKLAFSPFWGSTLFVSIPFGITNTNAKKKCEKVCWEKN